MTASTCFLRHATRLKGSAKQATRLCLDAVIWKGFRAKKQPGCLPRASLKAHPWRRKHVDAVIVIWKGYLVLVRGPYQRAEERFDGACGSVIGGVLRKGNA